MSARPEYPLQWPEGWKRTDYVRRGVPKFLGRFTQDRDDVVRRLSRRGSRIVITSDLPLRNDGLPYANATASDPGIAVYWIETKFKNGIASNTEHVLACDKWRRIGDNMRAIAKTLEALNGIERWGASQIVERAFAGFAALPPGSSGVAGGPVKRSWREVIGGVWPALASSELLAIAKARHRAAIAEAHPDRGGDHTRAAELNAAMAEAEADLGGAA